MPSILSPCLSSWLMALSRLILVPSVKASVDAAGLATGYRHDAPSTTATKSNPMLHPMIDQVSEPTSNNAS